MSGNITQPLYNPQIVNVGSSPNDGMGDPIRTAFMKVNDNNLQLFSLVQTPPDSPFGKAGDIPGMTATEASNGAFYYCYAEFDGINEIWSKASAGGDISYIQNGVTYLGIPDPNGNIIVRVGVLGGNNTATFTPTGFIGNIADLNSVPFVYTVGNTTFANIDETNFGNANIDISVIGDLTLTSNSVHLGNFAGLTQGEKAVAIGYGAGSNLQATGAVAIGFSAGNGAQGAQSIAIGTNAANFGQLQNSIAIGNGAAANGQSTSSIAVGFAAGQQTQGANSVAIGTTAGLTGQQLNSVAIGNSAGQTNQNAQSVAIGNNAGATTQGAQSVAIGNNAGRISQGSTTIAIGSGAGSNNQDSLSIAIGSGAGGNTQGFAAIALGSLSGEKSQSSLAISIGRSAGANTQGNSSIAIGDFAGRTTQGTNSIAIGTEAAQNSQGSDAIAIGRLAGTPVQASNSIAINATGANLNAGTSGLFIKPVRQAANVAITERQVLYYEPITGEITFDVQGSGNASFYDLTVANRLSTNTFSVSSNGVFLGNGAGGPGNISIRNSIAIGSNAGSSGQANATIAIGVGAGLVNQRENAISIGQGAGSNTQQGSSIAIGTLAGSNAQSANSIALGSSAGLTNQNVQAIAIGPESGKTNQGPSTIAIGYQSGLTNQDSAAIAIGLGAGQLTQGRAAISLGEFAGEFTQGSYSLAIGYAAGSSNQGTAAVAIGNRAGADNQGQGAVAIGRSAGGNLQGANSIAIGTNAGISGQPSNSIIINATGANLNATPFTPGLYIAPVRNDANNVANIVYYNASTKELTYTSLNFSQVSTNIIPILDNTYTLGNATNSWKSLYVAGNTIYIGGVPLSSSGNSLLVAGNTVLTTTGNTNVIPNDLTIAGNLTVQGNLTYIQSNVIEIGTKTIVLANAAADLTQAIGAGIEIGDANLASILVNSAGYWEFSLPLFGNGAGLTNINAANIVGSYGNANVADYLPTYTGDLTSLTGNITTTANVQANYFIGDGSQLTGLSSGYANADVFNYLGSNSNVVITTTGNITGANITADYFYGDGSNITGVISSYGNSNVEALLASGNVSDINISGNLTIGSNLNIVNVNEFFGSTGNISFRGNLIPGTDGNIYSLGLPSIPWSNIYATHLHGDGSNITNLPAGNYSNANVFAYLGSNSNVIITTTSDVTANSFIGDGSQLTNLPAGNYSNANVFDYLGSNSNVVITTTGNISGTYILGDGSLLTNLPAGDYSNANVFSYLGSNSLVVINTTGSVTASSFIGDGSQLTNLPVGYANANAVAYSESGWAGNIIPTGNGVYSLGNSTNYWSNLWVSSNTIYIGGVPLGVSGNVLTVDGQSVLINDGDAPIATTGDISGDNITANGNITASSINFTGTINGDGSRLTSINGANVSGAVDLATTAETVTTNAQPNITSVGTLTSLVVSGNVTTDGIRTDNYYYANGAPILPGAGVVDIIAGNGISLDNVDGVVTISATSNGNATVSGITNGTSGVTITVADGNINMTVDAVSIAEISSTTATYYSDIVANTLYGNGAGLTSINASNVNGTVANATYATNSGLATSATTADTATSAGEIVNPSGWNITPVGDKLYFNFNGANVGSLDSGGNFTVIGTVTAFGTP